MTRPYLLPLAGAFPTPIEDDDLQSLLESWVAGLTGLDPSLVRPRWTPTPPQQVDLPTNWVAVGVTDEEQDWLPATQQRQAADGSGGVEVVQAHADFQVQCSFYGPSAGTYSQLLKQGIAIEQNRATLTPAGISWVRTGQNINLSGPINGQYYRRLDRIVYLRRNRTQVYKINDVISSTGKIETDNGLSVNWSTENVKGK